jgi:hypothetical protein
MAVSGHAAGCHLAKRGRNYRTLTWSACSGKSNNARSSGRVSASFSHALTSPLGKRPCSMRARTMAPIRIFLRVSAFRLRLDSSVRLREPSCCWRALRVLSFVSRTAMRSASCVKTELQRFESEESNLVDLHVGERVRPNETFLFVERVELSAFASGHTQASQIWHPLRSTGIY